MNAPLALAVAQLDRGVKRCRDCAHCVKDTDVSVMDYCGRTVRITPATGAEGHWLCTIERESTRDGACGERAVHFTASENYLAQRSVRRMQNQRAIEQAIGALSPSATEAQEILAAITESLRERYGDKALDALAVAEEFRGALEEVE